MDGGEASLALTTIAPFIQSSSLPPPFYNTSDARNLSCHIPKGILEETGIQLVMAFLYILIFLVAVSGNVLVIYVVLSNKKMQTVTNLFITNLALSDLMIDLTSLWITPGYIYIGRWVFGNPMCHALPFVQAFSIFISTLTLTAIAVDRYLVIVHNSQSMSLTDHMSMRRCLMIIAGIWVVSFIPAFPYGYFMKTRDIDICDLTICNEAWTDDYTRKYYGWIVLLLQFAVPFSIIGVSYRRIWTFLANRRWASERTVEAARRKRLLSMLIIMVMLFAICWIPTNAMNIARDLRLISSNLNFTFYFLITHIIAMTATCWNPIIYAWMNESLREEFIRAIPIIRHRVPSAARIKMISECKPATNRTNCLDAPSLSTRSGSRQMSRQFETVLYNQDPRNGDSPETTLL